MAFQFSRAAGEFCPDDRDLERFCRPRFYWLGPLEQPSDVWNADFGRAACRSDLDRQEPADSSRGPNSGSLTWMDNCANAEEIRLSFLALPTGVEPVFQP